MSLFFVLTSPEQTTNPNLSGGCGGWGWGREGAGNFVTPPLFVEPL